MVILFLVFVLVAIIALLLCLRIVPASKEFVVLKLGKYYKIWEAGPHFLIPILFTYQEVDKRERVSDFKPQTVITQDNISIQIDTVVYHKVVDAKNYCLNVEKPINALENLTATTLRNLIGSMNLNQTLTSRDKINSSMKIILDEATDPWGIKVTRVEVKDIKPPADIISSMEKKLKAEREREAMILLADGEKKAEIARAAAYEQTTLQRKRADAEGIRFLLDAGLTTEQIVRLESLGAFKQVSDGQATKIIIPSDIQNMTGLVTALKESGDDSNICPAERKTTPTATEVNLDRSIERTH